MTISDGVLTLARALHGLAAVVWLGGLIYELTVLKPTPGQSSASAGRAQRDLAVAAFVVFLATGAILTFDRVTTTAVGTPYVTVLAAKILLALLMFERSLGLGQLVGEQRTRRLRIIVVVGLVVVLLAAILTMLYERALIA